MDNDSAGPSRAGDGRKHPPPGYRLVHEGVALPPFYAAEMLRSLIGKTVWVADSGGRVRSGELATVPWVKEDHKGDVPPVSFRDEKPLYLRRIVCIAVYDPKLAESQDDSSPAGQA